MAQLPGAEIPEVLSAELARALAGKGAGWQPRTHHVEGGAPHFTNRLIRETSPYLLQHAHNPVSWFAWGEEAFAEARRLNRPVLLSVGYSTCHWCHVMERESFEDLEIARFMNEHYVCIKLDREERPDVDAVYMTAVLQLHGSGGWPMTVWMTPDQHPFFAGTYFPARDGDRGNGRGFLSLLRELDALWANDRARVNEAAASLTNTVRDYLEEKSDVVQALPSTRIIDSTASAIVKSFDPVHGGLKRAPKFPSHVPIRLLLRHHARTQAAESLHAASFTLEKMAAGGMYDQLAGGFHRYSVDREWLVPHFEKMLYDNALLAVAYCEAHQLTGRDDFARVARETLEYLAREMRSPEGAFFSATDADSEGEEGTFFVWSELEIRAALGNEAVRFIAHYGVTGGGNFEGANILFVARPSESEHAALGAARGKLRAIRERREKPLRDEKIIASWNGLAISAFATAARVLREPRFLACANEAAKFVVEKMRVNGRLLRTFKDGRAAHLGVLDDHAFVIAGLLDLFEVGFDARWLDEALSLANEVEAHFADPRGGWFVTRDDGEKLLAREKPNHDGAEPSGASVQALNALRLAELTQDSKWRTIAERALAFYAPLLAERPLALSEMLLALEFARAVPRELMVVWPDGASFPDAFAEVLARQFVPAKVVAGCSQSQVADLARRVPLIEGKLALGGRATGYVCEQGACQLPTSDASELRRQLSAR